MQKIKFKNSLLVNLPQLVCFMVPLSLLAISLVFQVPLIPLLGIPVFVFGFARPSRTWPTTGASYADQEDSALYIHMTNQLFEMLPPIINGFSLGIDVFPGDILLLRHDPFIVWVEVAEKGFQYSSLVIKGMELQTTSCHAVEATHLDAYLDDVFQNGACINKRLHHTFEVC